MKKLIPILALALTLGIASAGDDVTARRYGYESWPAADRAREGVDPRAIRPEGLERRGLDVDPFRGEARLGFAPPSVEEPVVSLAVRVHGDATTAREALLAVLASTTRPLARGREAGLAAGDIGFVAADSEGRIAFVVLARGNITAVARTTRAPSAEGPLSATDADRALRAVVQAWERALFASPLLAPGETVPAPRVRALAASGPARAGKETPLALELDHAGPAAAWTAWQALDGASVVVTSDGPVLMAGKAGAVRVRVAVASKLLGSRVAETTVDVAP
jgi:hypothetical protein